MRKTVGGVFDHAFGVSDKQKSGSFNTHSRHQTLAKRQGGLTRKRYPSNKVLKLTLGNDRRLTNLTMQ